MHDTADSGISPAGTHAASRSLRTSLIVNLVLMLLQIVTGWLVQSQALIADGLHTLSDLLSDGVVMLTQPAAARFEARRRQRIESAATLVLGLMLLGVGGGMLWSAGARLDQPQSIGSFHVAALVVALGTLIAKELLFRHLMQVARQLQSSLLEANAWHARSDAASSLVVVCGIVGNLCGYPLLDLVTAVMVGLMIVWMGWDYVFDAAGVLHALRGEYPAASAASASSHPI